MDQRRQNKKSVQIKILFTFKWHYGFEIWSGSEANEYTAQRPCVDFWLAFAMGRGIKVEVPYYLLHTQKSNQNLYGYVSPTEIKGRF